MNPITQEFKKNINQINEYDYGDFMRSANVYLNHLSAQLSYRNDPSINEKIDQMKNYLQYTPNWDVDSTREKLNSDLQYIDELLQGHEQDWESDLN